MCLSCAPRKATERPVAPHCQQLEGFCSKPMSCNSLTAACVEVAKGDSLARLHRALFWALRSGAACLPLYCSQAFFLYFLSAACPSLPRRVPSREKGYELGKTRLGFEASIVPLKQIEHGVYEDLDKMYWKACSIHLRRTTRRRKKRERPPGLATCLFLQAGRSFTETSVECSAR